MKCEDLFPNFQARVIQTAWFIVPHVHGCCNNIHLTIWRSATSSKLAGSLGLVGPEGHGRALWDRSGIASVQKPWALLDRNNLRDNRQVLKPSSLNRANSGLTSTCHMLLIASEQKRQKGLEQRKPGKHCLS